MERSRSPEEIRASKFGLHRDFIDAGFHEPYILSGYRKPYITALDCVKSTFVFSCNESFNILSHLIAFSYLAAKYGYVFTSELSLREPLHWPLFSLAVGMAGFCLMSALAHMFNAMSPQTRNRCFFLDYAAISIYTVGAGQSFYFYVRPLNASSTLFDSPNQFLYISMATSFLSTTLCCASRTKWHSVKYIIRTLAYVLPFFVNSFPYFYRLFTCDNEIDCDTTYWPLYLKHGLYHLLSAIANVTKFPERFIPGKFDALGQSHHLMHILLPIGCDLKFEFLKHEMLLRKEHLTQHKIQPDAYNTLLLMLGSIVVNVGIALFINANPPEKKLKKK